MSPQATENAGKSSLQTNKIEWLEVVKLAIKVWLPYIQTSNRGIISRIITYLPSVIPSVNELQGDVDPVLFP